jgi:AcrR family transcriptional regulator
MPRPSVEAERREQILDATCVVIADVGLQDLHLSDVAKVAGVSSGMVHYYFASKKELVNSAFEFNFSNSLEQRQWMLKSDKDPLSILQDLVESYLPTGDRSMRAWRVWAELWAEGMRAEALQEVNERLYGEWRNVVAEVIQKAQEQGLARPGDPLLMANMLIGMLDGLAVQVLLRSPSMPLHTMRNTCHAFIDQVLARGSDHAR